MKVIISYPPFPNIKGTPMIAQNRQYQIFGYPTYIYPIVPAQAATLLKNAGHEVIWLDCIAEGISYDRFIEVIRQEKPDLIAFETKTPVVKQHWKIINDIKAGTVPAIANTILPKAKGTVPKIVLFGDHVTALPEESFKNSSVDFVCSLDYQEPVFILKNNRVIIRPIGKIIDSYFDNREEDFQIKKVFDIKVPVYDCNLKIKFAPATKVIRHKIKEPLYEIELRSGRKVRVTGSHSVYLLYNGKIVPKKVSELQKGDYLAIPQRLPIQNVEEIDIAHEIKKDFIPIKDDFLIYSSCSGPKAKIARHIKISKELCKILGYFISEGHIQQVMRPYPAKMLGFTFGPSERQIVNELIICLEKVFGDTISVKKYLNEHSISVRVTNPLLPILFEDVFNTGVSAETKHVPCLIFNTTYQNRMAFLEGYFQGDGTIHINKKRSWKTAELIAKTASRDLANELLYLFLTVGIIASIKQDRSKKHKVKETGQVIDGSTNYLVRITGKEQLSRLPLVWRRLKKSSEIRRIITTYRLFRKSEFSSIPINHVGLTELYKGKYLIRGCKKGIMSRERILNILTSLENSKKYPKDKILKIKKIIEGEVNFLEVVNIKRVKSTKNYVYDFCVDGHEKFVGGLGGIFLHNTGGDYDFLLLNLCNALTHEHTNSRTYELTNIRTTLEPGIYYRDNGQIENTGPFQLNHDLNSLPFIDRDLTKWQLYAYKNGNYKRTPGTYLMSGRDCWWGRCTFCSWPQMYTQFRLRNVENVLDEIGMLIAKYHIREIMDDTGSFPIGDWLRQFCQGIIARGYNKKIYLDCNMRFGALKPEDFSLMKKANFRLILFGLESANQKTLDRINKNLKNERIIEDCKAASKAGLFPHITIMFGYPWEGYEDALKTLNLGKWLLKKGYAYTIQATIVIPYPGSPLFEEAKLKGWLKTFDWNDYDMKQPVMQSPVPDGQVMEFTQQMYKTSFQPEFMLRKVLSLRDTDDLKYYIRAAKKVCGHIFDFGKPKNTK